MNCICLNEKTRTEFEFMGRDVFRKFKALYPEDQIKPFFKDHNAIEAIYEQLNQKIKGADITDVIQTSRARSRHEHHAYILKYY